MRILHAPNNIANQAWATAQGLRALGHEVEVWHYGPNPFDFQADRFFEIENRADRSIEAFRDAIARDFDVYHFHFARSLVPAVGGLPWFWDLPVLRALGKRIVFTFHGSDVRKRSVHMAEDPWSYFRFSDVESDEERIDKALAVIRTYAQHLVVASPLNYPFVGDAVYVPKTIEVERFPFVGPPRRQRPLIVHVPSRRATKGTEFVLRGLEELERRGVWFEFRLVEDVPHEELASIYEQADVVVDNLLFGDCEVSSLEAMALGKPVVTRIRDEVRSVHPDLPAVRADPDTFVDAIEPVLRDGHLRQALGEQGRAYVERNHAPEVVAAKLVPLYEEPVRPAWRVFPEWTGLATDRKLESYEQRIQELEVRIAELKRRLSDESTLVGDLRALYGGSRPLAMLRELRKFRRR
jgi:glycosyltransferase involved in cell wall biosynthesis